MGRVDFTTGEFATMNVEFVPVSGAPSQGIPALQGFEGGAAYSDCVRVDLPGHCLLFVSGKMGTKDGRLVGTTMAEQARQVLENIRTSIERQGGRMQDIVRLRIYVVQIDEPSIREVHAARKEFFASGRFPASTLVRVGGLVREGGLIEMEADVVLPARG
jgi:enamine deaminase RidA (YjgF/YER057c/UK114 family)